MQEDLFEGLQKADFDGGEEHEAEPEVDHRVAVVRNVGGCGGVGPNKALGEEAEEALLEGDEVVGGGGGRELGINGGPHGVEFGEEGGDPCGGAPLQDVHGEALDLYMPTRKTKKMLFYQNFYTARSAFVQLHSFLCHSMI